jgi:U32 family peptidase
MVSVPQSDSSLEVGQLRKGTQIVLGSDSGLTAEEVKGALSVVPVKPEILSPAGGWPQLEAAVNAGCDAVYFGLQEGFNARARATNFAVEELDRVMTYLHSRQGCCGTEKVATTKLMQSV